jgi:hypothetical protein
MPPTIASRISIAAALSALVIIALQRLGEVVGDQRHKFVERRVHRSPSSQAKPRSMTKTTVISAALNGRINGHGLGPRSSAAAGLGAVAAVEVEDWRAVHDPALISPTQTDTACASLVARGRLSRQRLSPARRVVQRPGRERAQARAGRQQHQQGQGCDSRFVVHGVTTSRGRCGR